MFEKNSLFTPLKIGKKTVPNRIAINAMECCDSDDDGNAQKELIEGTGDILKADPE